MFIKTLSELTTSNQWVQCECGNATSHKEIGLTTKEGCPNSTRRKFLVQSDIEDDSYWLCSHCVGYCVWSNLPDVCNHTDEMITDQELGKLLDRYLT